VIVELPIKEFPFISVPKKKMETNIRMDNKKLFFIKKILKIKKYLPFPLILSSLPAGQ